MGADFNFARVSLFFFVSASGMAAPAAKYLTLNKILPVTIQAGKKAEIKISATVDNGLHVQANPAGAPNLIATTLDIPSKDALQTSAPVYPAGKPHVVSGIGNVPTYDGTFQITVPLTATADAKSGQVTLDGKLRYQACSEKTCFFPMTIAISVPVTVKN
jgi:uncharacterized protein